MINKVKASIGDTLKIKTKEKEWTGTLLDSYEQEITLLKLDSGYNIGIRNSEITDINLIQKRKQDKKEKISLPKKEGLKNIAMIITGGTISSRLDPKTGGVRWTSAEDILKIAPEIADICNITRIEKPFMKGSEDMGLKEWAELAECAHKLLKSEEIDGIIITHGTDILHYSGAALSFFIQKLNKPIALTYSQRSIDRASTDAHLNLICAARYATSDIAQVALIGHKNLEDIICVALNATKCRKMHSSRRDAFRAINCEPIAEITKEDIKIQSSFNARNDGDPRLDTKFSKKVATIKVTPSTTPEILDFYEKQGYKGLILEATGLGHVPGKESENNLLPKIKKMVKNGMIICISAQTIYGSLNPNVYSNGRELQKTGVIFLEDMLSETAFVKLSWILGHKSWVYNEKNAKEKMQQDIAGEFNKKRNTKDF